MQMKMTMRSLKFGVDLPGSLFVFTPPEGAKETTELFPGMPISEPAGEEAAKPVTAASSNEPQAYVPHMHPIEQVEPKFPEEARKAGLDRKRTRLNSSHLGIS